MAEIRPTSHINHRAPRTSWSAGANLFAGSTFPADLLGVITHGNGEFPADNGTNPTRNDWTTSALIDPLWADGVPDVVVSMRWTTEKNQAGTPGMVAADVPGLAAGQGAHVSLSPFDLHNTLVAAGPDFRSGVVDTLASGNVDVAPTVLWILGLKPPKPMDGRVLTEALTIAGPQIKSFEPCHIETTCEQEGVAWHQYLNFTEVNGVVYYDEGNGHQTSR